MIVLRLIHFLAFLSLMLLQACQHNTDIEQAAATKKQRAAFYNRQLGLAYLQQEDRPRAKRKLLTALDLAPDSPDINVAMAYYLEKTGDVQEARAYYQKALALAPNSGAQLNNYGAFLCRLGQYREAIDYFAKAVTDIHYIDTAGAYENAGLCAMAIPDYSTAKRFFVRALEQDPGRKQSLYELVKAELKQEEPEKALNYLHNYSSLFLSDPSLLVLAVDAAHRVGKADEEKNYQERLSRLTQFRTLPEQNNEYDRNNG